MCPPPPRPTLAGSDHKRLSKTACTRSDTQNLGTLLTPVADIQNFCTRHSPFLSESLPFFFCCPKWIGKGKQVTCKLSYDCFSLQTMGNYDIKQTKRLTWFLAFGLVLAFSFSLCWFAGFLKHDTPKIRKFVHVVLS